MFDSDKFELLTRYFASENLAGTEDHSIARVLTAMMRDQARLTPSKEDNHFKSVEHSKLIRTFIEKLIADTLPQVQKLDYRKTGTKKQTRAHILYKENKLSECLIVIEEALTDLA